MRHAGTALPFVIFHELSCALFGGKPNTGVGGVNGAWRTRALTFLGLLSCLFFAGSIRANAQFNVVGAPPVPATAAREQVKTLLEKVDSGNRQQTVATISGLLTWYRDLVDEELIAAWHKDGRANLPEVIELLADSHLASAIVEYSWIQQRQAAFSPAYAPMLGHLMARYPESAKPFLDDLLGPQPADLSQAEAEAVCRILLDMPDLGTWRKSALQILPHYRRVAENLLAQDIRGGDKEKSYSAQRWLTSLKAVDPAFEAQSSTASATPPRLVAPAPAANAQNRQNAPSAPTPSTAAHGGVVLTPLNPAAVDDTLHSVAYTTPAVIDFVNRSNTPVDIYWINYQGDRRLDRAGLPVGATWSESTFLTHPFLVVVSGTGGTTAQDTGPASPRLRR
jgi:hypothetical protein